MDLVYYLDAASSVHHKPVFIKLPPPVQHLTFHSRIDFFGATFAFVSSSSFHPFWGSQLTKLEMNNVSSCTSYFPPSSLYFPDTLIEAIPFAPHTDHEITRKQRPQHDEVAFETGVDCSCWFGFQAAFGIIQQRFFHTRGEVVLLS
jgi:hypothetical protein